ncbi:acyltransferase family-domain-containing protein [Xylariales sp. PMI_506]|nr:acyltransferase family-domain-containing protein [Xylariales sp. PMI_506]
MLPFTKAMRGSPTSRKLRHQLLSRDHSYMSGIDLRNDEQPQYTKVPDEDLELDFHDETDGIRETKPAAEDIESGSTPRWVQRTRRIEWMWKLLPWFLTAPLGKTDRELPKVTSTSYLNGIRGVASFIVLTYHIATNADVGLLNPYGFGEPDQNRALIQLPPLRLIYAGSSMVCVFFVLSGFVLTYSPQRKMSANPGALSGELFSSLSSSIFRRAIRLFVPMVSLVILTPIAISVYPSFQNLDWGGDGYLALVWRFLQGLFNLMDPFIWTIVQPPGLDHCWTLALEFRGSMVVYILCMATAQFRPFVRIAITGAVGSLAMYWGRWELFLFAFGMVLAALRFDPLLPHFASYLPKRIRSLRMPPPTRFVPAVLLFIVSIFFLCWPEFGDGNLQPWATMILLFRPEGRSSIRYITFMMGSIGASMCLLSIESLPWIQRQFERKPMLYLGEISYSFYLLHWLVFHGIGKRVQLYLVELGISYVTTVLLGSTTTLVILIILADYHWRLVDESCVKLGKIVFDWLSVRKPGAPPAIATPSTPGVPVVRVLPETPETPTRAVDTSNSPIELLDRNTAPAR